MSRDFDGVDDRVSMGDKASFSPTDMTILCWAKGDVLTTTSGPTGRRWLVTKGQAGAYEYSLLAQGNGSISAISMRIFNTITNNYLITVGASGLSVGRWYFLGGTYDNASTTARAYVDCVEDGVDSTPDGTRSGDGGAPLLIGDRQDDATNAWDGLIAHTMLFSRVLSVNEIRQCMFYPGSIVNGLVGYWPLWGVSPEPDYSGNINNGTVTGALVSTDNPPISSISIIPNHQFMAN